MNYLEGLNKAQQEAVINYSGPTMIIAGAGSGKTRVLTYRIAHLINSGIDPFNILALTFTNKAAREMKERIAKIIGSSESQNVWMGTFHSVFAKILRIEHERIGFPRDFTIYDTTDAKNLVKDIIKEFQLDDKIYKPGLVYGRISAAKNNLLSAKDYAQNTELIGIDRQSGKPRIHEIFKTYEIRCFKAGAMDFDDLLYKMSILLRDNPDLLEKYQYKFKYILVDEYQDTNYAQYYILKKLAAKFQNICVVGDDAQSIYAFRGANIQNILNFKHDYPDYKIFKLEQNYRSTQTIVNAANSVIEKNKERIEKEIWTNNEKGEKIKIIRALTDNEEGRMVADHIAETLLRQQLNYNDFAILYRTNAQSRAFEESLRKRNIPYKIYGGMSFYQRKEIKDLLAYFRLVCNHNDEEALKRIINYPKRGIGQTTVDALIVCASRAQTGIWNIIESPEIYGLKLAPSTLNKLNEFALMIKSFKAQLQTHSASDLAEYIAKSTGLLKELYDDKTPEGVSRYENIQELLNAVKEFSENASHNNETATLSDFLIEVALLTDAEQDNDELKEHVSLMTIHAAKGLEFKNVYIVGLEENLFPSQLSLSSRSELEEERRLFYVALTRAEKQATLSYASTRYKWGNLVQCEPSRFIDEIDIQYLEMPTEPPAKNTGHNDFDTYNSHTGKYKDLLFDEVPLIKKNNPVLKNNMVKINLQETVSSSADTSTLNIQTGDNVLHEKFGKGKVLQIEGIVPNQKATIFFPEVGQKQLLLRFAKLQIIK